MNNIHNCLVSSIQQVYYTTLTWFSLLEINLFYWLFEDILRASCLWEPFNEMTDKKKIIEHESAVWYQTLSNVVCKKRYILVGMACQAIKTDL